MVSTFNQSISHVTVQTNNRTAAAEGLEGVLEMNTLCGTVAGIWELSSEATMTEIIAFLNSVWTQLPKLYWRRRLPSLMRMCIQKLQDLIYSRLVRVSLFLDDINWVYPITFLILSALLDYLCPFFTGGEWILSSRRMFKSVDSCTLLLSLSGPLCTVQLHVTASISVRCSWSRGPPFSPQQLAMWKQRQTNVKRWRRAIHSVPSSSTVGRYRQTGGETTTPNQTSTFLFSQRKRNLKFNQTCVRKWQIYRIFQLLMENTLKENLNQHVRFKIFINNKEIKIVFLTLKTVFPRCAGKVGCDEQRFGLRSLGLHSPAGWWAVLQRGGRTHRAASTWRHRDRVVVGTTQRPRGIRTQKPAGGERAWDDTTDSFSLHK